MPSFIHSVHLPSHSHHAHRASRATTTTATTRSVRAKPSRTSRVTASIVATRSVRAEAHCACCCSVREIHIIIYNILTHQSKTRLPRLRCRKHMSSKAALSSLKRREARGVKQCVNSPYCQPEDKGPLRTLLGGLALLFPGAAIIIKSYFVCGALYYYYLKVGAALLFRSTVLALVLSLKNIIGIIIIIIIVIMRHNNGHLPGHLTCIWILHRI